MTEQYVSRAAICDATSTRDRRAMGQQESKMSLEFGRDLEVRVDDCRLGRR